MATLSHDSRPRTKTTQHAMSVQWAALQDAGDAVAALAGLAKERASAEQRNFPAHVRDIGGAAYELAARGVADLMAMMQPGLAALLAVNARGQDATAPALTLWREYHAARSALLKLAPVDGLGPRRSA